MSYIFVSIQTQRQVVKNTKIFFFKICMIKIMTNNDLDAFVVQTNKIVLIFNHLAAVSILTFYSL